MLRPVVAAVAFAAVLLPVPPASAAHPESIPLPVDFQPEGIALGTGDTFYVGSLVGGDIFRGDLSTGEGEVFIDVSGRAALGMRVDEARSLLFVAGGPGGHAYVYDARDGSEIADLVVGPPSSLINDVAIADGVAWFTDTLNASLYRVPYGGGSFGPATTLSVTGPAGATGVGVLGLNGIDTSSDGKTLIVNHTNLGILASVDTTTGVSTQIPITGGSLMPGTLDGLQIQGRTLYVVQNFANSIVEVDLSADLSSGVVDETITSSLFQVPTTVVVSGGRLAAVNGRFDLGFPPPFGPGAPPGTTFDVVQVRK